ncbi:MAG: L-rhamnose isomerase, partial [Candidatus Latescibacteria bacterium]|nr:L-rhamnose isomerase [Candidatus Latescibacterota bacterium]
MPIPSPTSSQLDGAYTLARERYAEFGIDTDAAIDAAVAIPISLHCWQTDDVAGLENAGKDIAGAGIMATGNFPGKARTGDEIRSDLTQVMALLPGVQRVNLHASYAEFGDEQVERDEQRPEHFARWISWAKDLGIGLDFNTTFFAHPKADDGYTLAHPDAEIRNFWIRHGIACRHIAQHIGGELGPCVLNHWIPDGCKDYPTDRWTARKNLVSSYDEMFDERHGIDTDLCIDAVESKLFGLGSEEFVTGSAEFYSNYALSRDMV